MTDSIFFGGNTYSIRPIEFYDGFGKKITKFFWAAGLTVGGIGYGKYSGVYSQPFYARCVMFDYEEMAVDFAEKHGLLQKEHADWNDHD